MNHRENIENFTLIYYDSSVTENNKNDNRTMLFEQFQCIVNTVHVFDNLDVCIDYITGIKHEFVILVIGDSSNALETFEKVLDQLTNLYFIYLLNQYESRSIMHRKVRGVFSTITTICTQLQKDLKRSERDLINFNAVSENISTNDEQEANFMCAQLLKECLLDIATSENDDLIDLIEYCRKQYADNRHELARIDEFKRDYANHLPIWWYTRDGFLYKMLNKALRVQDVETLYAMRTFIKHLHNSLETISVNSISFRPMIVYRGQQMSSNELMILKKNQGGLLSINNFLSTTENKNLAMIFAGNNVLVNDEMVPVLLEIHVINDLTDTPPFAKITEYSSFGESENEILFSMSTVFRIESVTQQHSDDDIWLIKLTLTNAKDPQLAQLTDHMREQVQHAAPRDRLCQLLLNIGKYIEAEYFLKRALQEIKTNDQQSQAAIHHQLGFVYHEMGHLEKALEEYEQTLAIKLSIFPDDYPELSVTLANMSSIYRELDQLDLALTYINRALRIDQQQSNNERILADRYHSMGMIVHDLNHIDEAIEYFNKALTIWKRYLPPTHPNITEGLSNLAAIYYGQQHYDQALGIYKQCLDLDMKSLPTGHPSLAITYNNLAYTYYHLDHYQDALSHSLKAIEISSRALGDEHPNTITFRKTLQTINEKLASRSKSRD